MLQVKRVRRFSSGEEWSGVVFVRGFLVVKRREVISRAIC